MKKNILSCLNAVLGAAVVALVGTSTGCKTAKVKPVQQEKEPVAEEQRIRMLYGTPSARYEVMESRPAEDETSTTQTAEPLAE